MGLYAIKNKPYIAAVGLYAIKMMYNLYNTHCRAFTDTNLVYKCLLPEELHIYPVSYSFYFMYGLQWILLRA